MIRESAIRIPFRYAAGAAGSRFLAALRDEQRILGARCSACARVLVPLRAFCPSCGGGTLDEIEVGPGGSVQTWTTRADGTAFALILLDGASTGIVHRLLGAAAEVRCGLRVRARFAGERHGGILDIAGFEPAQGCAA